MNHTTKADLPHAVYRMFSADSTLLYVGCSTNPFGGRLNYHGAIQPWAQEIACVKVEWYPTWETGQKAEATAILTENPLYNRAKIPPENIGKWIGHVSGPPRKDLRTCPKCGKQKENPRPGKAYCNACYREYKKVRRLQALTKC